MPIIIFLSSAIKFNNSTKIGNFILSPMNINLEYALSGFNLKSKKYLGSMWLEALETHTLRMKSLPNHHSALLYNGANPDVSPNVIYIETVDSNFWHSFNKNFKIADFPHPLSPTIRHICGDKFFTLKANSSRYWIFVLNTSLQNGESRKGKDIGIEGNGFLINPKRKYGFFDWVFCSIVGFNPYSFVFPL